ncbi:MAG: hypothetical protein JWM20_715 [Patescibacteria group bacterium]|nr:hypothetical protein [Patescibacteria group bacterium]
METKKRTEKLLNKTETEKKLLQILSDIYTKIITDDKFEQSGTAFSFRNTKLTIEEQLFSSRNKTFIKKIKKELKKNNFIVKQTKEKIVQGPNKGDFFLIWKIKKAA